MKFIPSRYSFIDEFMDDMFNPVAINNEVMKTDIHEKDGKYFLDMELPGFNKEDIEVSLKNGNLVVSASQSSDKEEKDDKGNIIRQERYSGSYSRSFYVGNSIKEEDISARYENGELKLAIINSGMKTEEKKLIAIE